MLATGMLWFIVAGAAGVPLGTIGQKDALTATPSPGECDSAPRTVSEIQALADSASDSRPPAGPLPVGTPANAATIASIGNVLIDMSACLTAGQMLRFYALHSDAWLQRFTAGIGDLTTYTTSTPPLDDGQSARYLGPWHVHILPDGRVMAAVLLSIGTEQGPDPNRVRVLLFVRQDGRWLVDETIETVVIAACESPVEVAAIVGPPPGAVFDAWLVSCDEKS